jgi:acyl-CoA thioester hydrolase
MFTSSTEIRVRYAETDQMGVVYHGNYFAYFETARAESIREMGLTYADIERLGVIMPVIEVNCRYLRAAKYDDLITVKVILKHLPLDHKIEFHHEVYNETGELLATARVILYFMEAKTMKKSTMPGALLEKLKPFFK